MVIYIGTRAKQSMRDIFAYYLNNFGRNSAQKVRDRIKKNIGRLKSHPFLGAVEWEIPDGSCRSLVIHPHYKMIYRVNKLSLYIIDIWDCRQDPRRMNEFSDLPKE